MGLTTTKLTRLRYAADENSLERAGGRQINWAAITAVDGVKRVRAGTVVGHKAGKLQPCDTQIALTSIVVAGNNATATLANHGFAVGDVINVTLAPELSYVTGVRTILTVPNANTFTFAVTGANGSTTASLFARVAAQGILESDATEEANAESLSGYSLLVGGVLYENLLPGTGGGGGNIVLPAAYKTELTAAGCTFKYVQYVDSRS